MKKFLFLVIVVLALFTIDHPMIKEPREKLLGEGVGILSSASNVNRGPAANMAKNRIKSALSLSESELEYLEETMQTDEQLQLFHTRYCRSKDLNLYFYEDRLNTVCKIAAESLAERRGK
ncbi:hypothetical protein NQT69_19245 [Pseudoalteromonas shioyasakiensis]|uniref:hypothetical protein n=1 Tax=Pseudoalteromonas shioyasakiensis TaxID=1190813 RepID=UPI002117BE1C|nr:hypothetical protein [Pseudoalteromonas shioyasakiensis]MCQ8880134.1 hypothetical protein [Pseudoalteromonas shioyasakiensis]